jgi:hypothetical protein
MLYEVEITARVYVSIEHGGEEAVQRLVRDHVCNDWLLQHRDGAANDAGHFVVKGLSGAVESVQPWIGNRRVSQKEDEDEEDA